MSKPSMMKQYSTLLSSGLLTLAMVGGMLLGISAMIISLGYLLFYVSQLLFHQEIMGIFHYVFVVLAIGLSFRIKGWSCQLNCGYYSRNSGKLKQEVLLPDGEEYVVCVFVRGVFCLFMAVVDTPGVVEEHP